MNCELEYPLQICRDLFLDSLEYMYVRSDWLLKRWIVCAIHLHPPIKTKWRLTVLRAIANFALLQKVKPIRSHYSKLKPKFLISIIDLLFNGNLAY